MLRPILAVMAALALGATPATACDAPRVAKGAPYPKARQLLITQGYIPIATPADSKGPNCAGEYGFPQCDVYPEIHDCSGTGLAACTYLYRCRKTDRYIFVITEGEPWTTSELDRLRFVWWQPLKPGELRGAFERDLPRD